MGVVSCPVGNTFRILPGLVSGGGRGEVSRFNVFPGVGS